MHTVQVLGDSTLQFLGEVVGGPVVATTGAGDGPDSADSGGSTAAAPGLVCGLARCCARQGLSSELFSDKVAEMPVLLIQTVQMQFLDKVIHVPVILTTRARGGPDSAVLAVQCGARGVSTGAVLGQVVHARRCHVWCRWPDSAENCGDSTGAVLVKVYMPVVFVWCQWPDSAENCGDSTGAVLVVTTQKTVEIPQVPFLDKVYPPVVFVWCQRSDNAENCGDSFHRCRSWTRCTRPLSLLWCQWPDSAENCGYAAVAVIRRESAENCGGSTVQFIEVVDYPSPCTSRVWRAGEDPWKFHRCSSRTRCSRLLLLCVADGQTVQETVEMPQFQFLNKFTDVIVISQGQVPEKGTIGALNDSQL